MSSKNISRQEIPVSKGNNLYFVDESLVQFARNYEAAKESRQNTGLSTSKTGISCPTVTSIGSSGRNR